MLRFLPFILILVLVLGGFGYYRFVVSKPSLPSVTNSDTTQNVGAIEVLKTSSSASLEDRVKLLEDLAVKLVTQFNALKSSTSAQSSSTSQIDSLNVSITELKSRISALENVTPAPVTSGTSSKSTVYIPLGSGGGPWGNQGWYSLPEYEVSLDPANYPGYTGMVLEVTFRLGEAAGTGSVRLFNSSDNSATSSQLDTTSSEFSLKNSSSFKLASGSKSYKLQVKSTNGKDLFIQSARIKVSF